MSTDQPSAEVIDSVNNPTQPFGMPLGTVRGFLSLLICGFFWIVLLWPEQVVKPLLAHFFMLTLVLLVFSPHSKHNSQAENESQAFLPWLLRFLFVGGSIAVVAFVAVQFPDRLGGPPNGRLTPSPEEFQQWWGAYLACTFGGFSTGLLMRMLLGRENPIFQTLRAWLSVVGMLMLSAEIVFWFAIMGAENKPEEFVRIWQAFELAIVSAYFGTRA